MIASRRNSLEALENCLDRKQRALRWESPVLVTDTKKHDGHDRALPLWREWEEEAAEIPETC